MGQVTMIGGQHPKKDQLISEPSIMEDPSPVKAQIEDESIDSVPDSDDHAITTYAEASIASEFDYDPAKYATSSYAGNIFKT